MKNIVDGQALQMSRQYGQRPGGTGICENLTEYQSLEKVMGTKQGGWGGSEQKLLIC